MYIAGLWIHKSSASINSYIRTYTILLLYAYTILLRVLIGAVIQAEKIIYHKLPCLSGSKFHSMYMCAPYHFYNHAACLYFTQ